MFNLKIIFFFFVFPLTCSARELSVTNNNLKYTLNYNEELIHYNTIDADLSLKKEECNAHIIKRFVSEMGKFLKEPFANKFSPEFFEVKLDGIQLYSSRVGERALFLMSMHNEIKKIKIEEAFNCPKKMQ